MNTTLTIPQTAAPQPSPADLARLSLLLAGAIVVALAGILGGMQYVIIALALGLAILVARKPKEAVPAGWLFMLAAMTLLPATGRFHYVDSQTIGIDWQQYYWAAGSLIIVLAALYGAGFSSLIRAPMVIKMFLLVAIAAAIFGFFRGNETSYVIRQFYGSILFVLYFAIARAAGDEELLFLRLKTFGVLVAVAFFVYYATIFSEWGFHKEDTSLPIQMGIFAMLLVLKGLIDKRLSWIAYSGVLFTASFLLFFRNILLTFFFATTMALAIRSTSRMRKVLYFGIAALILLPSVFPFGAQYVLDVLTEKAPKIYDILPQGTQTSTTLMDRSIQIGASALLLVHSPVFGGGMGTDLSWVSDLGDRQEMYIDNGWAYLMAKMGCAGILAFGWLLVTILRCMSRQSLVISISLLALLMIAMFSEPICFQFTTSPIAGALAGMLYVRKYPVSRSSGTAVG